MAVYVKIAAGQWVSPRHRGYLMKCCDCGLVHRMDFRIVNGRILFRVYRENRATASARAAKTRRHKSGAWRMLL